MRRIFFGFCCTLFLFLGSYSAHGQSNLDKNITIDVKKEIKEDEGPVMFKFEPDYTATIEKRRDEIARTKEILDTLDISENRRRKLLRDLYKSGVSKRLSKVLVVDSSFEDLEN